MSAKKLCSMLITRSLKDLNDDEEEIVVDYLESLGIRVKLDMSQKEICVSLLEKLMEKELGRRVPMTAFANKLITQEEEQEKKRSQLLEKRRIEKVRKDSQEKLASKTNLPACLKSDLKILSDKVYDLIIDPNIGIVSTKDGTSQYTAVISIPEPLYSKIFANMDRPILELKSSNGIRTYARIWEPHYSDSNTIYISPLVASILNINKKGSAYVSLCSSIPTISKIDFTYYGSKSELNQDLPSLLEKLPSLVSAFSYLSLGMILVVDLDNREIQVRVDQLLDDDRPIFAGVIPFSESDIPFDIEADLQ